MMMELVQPDMFPDVKSYPRPDDVPNERYTPWSTFLPLDQEFNFTLDVCATPESAKCDRFFTAVDNGLEQSWAGERVWCNPPYDEIDAWLMKAWLEDVESAVMLLPAWTDRLWWAELVERYRDSRSPYQGKLLTTRFIRGRVCFGHPGNPEAIGVDSPPFWCVLLIWRRA